MPAALDRPEEGATNVGNNLHVSGLARSIDPRFLDDLFGKYGKVCLRSFDWVLADLDVQVQKAEVMSDPHTRALTGIPSIIAGCSGPKLTHLPEESRGFGFVKMETGEDANAVIEALNGTTVEGKVMTVAHVCHSDRRSRSVLMVTGSPWSSSYTYSGPIPRCEDGLSASLRRIRLPSYAVLSELYITDLSIDRPYQPRSYDSRYADRGPPPRGCQSSFIYSSWTHISSRRR